MPLGPSLVPAPQSAPLTVPDDLPTPRSISRTGYRVHVWSKACRRAKDAELAALIAAGHGNVPLVQMKWRCGNCGSR